MMKKANTLLLFIISAITVCAQPAVKNGFQNNVVTAERKFQILVKNEENPDRVKTNTKAVEDKLEERNKMISSNDKSSFLTNLSTSFGSALTQNTINATSNVLSMSISYLVEKFRSHQQDWYRTALQQCTYKKSLKSESKIDDFYGAPSSKGALDPADIIFDGFGCKHFLEVRSKKSVYDENGRKGNADESEAASVQANQGQQQMELSAHDKHNGGGKAEESTVNNDSVKIGKDVFYLFCKLRRDSTGIAHIVNHSKFMVEVDSFMFNIRYCNLPNDSTGSIDSRFDFNKRKDLSLKVKAKVYSSWVNEAIMVMQDQLLGEFIITVKIDRDQLQGDSLFVYDKNNKRHTDLVSISGDSFIVPRSFTGTSNFKDYTPMWGTGQYRIEMEIEENCKINDEYYLIRESGSGQKTAFADGTPGKRRWDKEKWSTEWKAMKARKKNASFWQNAWDGIVTAYKGSGWVETFTDPLTTAIYSWEAEELSNWLDIDTNSSLSGGASGMSGGNATNGAGLGGITGVAGGPGGATQGNPK